jgi:hypothetical protein
MGRLVVAVTVTVALGGLAACGGDASDGVGGGGGAAHHACDLLSTEEAEQLLGVPTYGGSEDTDRSGGTYCEWVSKDSSDGRGDASDVDDEGEEDPYFVAVEENRGRGAVEDFESGRERGAEPVDGLGSDAYFRDPHGLRVRNGDQVVSIYASGNHDHVLSNREIRRIERKAGDFVAARLG